MTTNLKKFGTNLKNLRIEKGLSLRKMCQVVGFDPSNWSKIERGKNSPPSDIRILKKWAKLLGLVDKPKEMQNFLDEAQIAQGIIPLDILSTQETVDCLPAFFRTLRNKKPTKEEVNKLLELIKNA